jgi:hypothetical protein
MHTVNALHDRQVKIRNHWADIAPLQSVDIDDEGEVIVSATGNSHAVHMEILNQITCKFGIRFEPCTHGALNAN